MQSKLLSTLLLAGAATTSQFASASDGQITFSGNVIAQTCTIAGNGTGSNNFTVNLPTVSTSTLAAAGETAGRTPFNIALSSCTPDGGTVRVHFEQGHNVDTSTGNLNLEAGADSAQNVQISLLNSDLTKIAIGLAESSQNSRSVPISTEGAATLPFFAEYSATGAATPGAAKSSVMYSLTYQ